METVLRVISNVLLCVSVGVFSAGCGGVGGSGGGGGNACDGASSANGCGGKTGCALNQSCVPRSGNVCECRSNV